MDLKKLKEIIKHILIKDTSKNFVCKCPFCGDHPQERKKGHLYISKEKPVVHCFLCGYSTHLKVFIQQITGQTQLFKKIIPEENSEKEFKSEKLKNPNKKIFEIPDSDGAFKKKREYIKRRSGYRFSANDFSNLVLDIISFAKHNNIRSFLDEDESILDLFQRQFIGFLSRNHTMLFMRNINHNHKFKFKKQYLQNQDEFLDYVSFKGGSFNSSQIVMAEGTFDIISELAADSAGLFNSTNLYVATQSFSFSSGLKSLVFYEGLFRIDLNILSDSDKKIGNYYKIFKDNKHIIKSLNVYYNLNGNDFNNFPIKLAKYHIDLKNPAKNKSKNKIKGRK